MKPIEKLTRLIIESIHGCEYEEAVKKELTIPGCISILDNKWWNEAEIITYQYNKRYNTISALHDNEYQLESYDGDWDFSEDDGRFLLDDVQGLGLPITIGRVMAALNAELWGYYYATGEIWSGVITFQNITTELEKVCEWQLLKESGEEMTLEDQSEETIDALLELLTK